MKAVSKLNNRQPSHIVNQRKSSWMTGSLAVFTSLCCSLPALAEGSYQIGLNQPLYEYGVTNSLLLSIDRPLYVDIITAGEVINVSLCGTSDSDSVEVEIYDSFGTKVYDSGVVASNVSCTDDFDSPLTNPIQYVATAADTYEIRLYNQSGGTTINRFDVTVTADIATAPDPTIANGRLHAFSWAFNAGGYGQDEAADSNYYTLVPGGRAGENFVWLLDLNDFAGFVYEVVANNIGVDAPNSGLSTPQSGNSTTPLYPIYLGYPDITGTRPTIPPEIASFSFTDNEGIDNSISPEVTIGVQDSGTFQFDTDVDGTYAITIDTNEDGDYGVDDTLLLGVANLGTNSVFWDGRDNSDNALPSGSYNAQLAVRLGEYHFIAGDAETSGGGTNNGLTIYEALSGSTQSDTFLNDSDQGEFITLNTMPPSFCQKSDPADPDNLIPANISDNTSGIVIVELDSPVPTAIDPAVPPDSYGFVRFRAEVQ